MAFNKLASQTSPLMIHATKEPSPPQMPQALVLSDARYFSKKSPAPLPIPDIIDSFVRTGYVTVALDDTHAPLSQLKHHTKGLGKQWLGLSLQEKGMVAEAKYPYGEGRIYVEKRPKDAVVQTGLDAFVGIHGKHAKAWHLHQASSSPKLALFHQTAQRLTQQSHETLHHYFQRLHEQLTAKPLPASEGTMAHLRIATYHAPKHLPSLEMPCPQKASVAQKYHQDRSFLTAFLDETSPGTHCLKSTLSFENKSLAEQQKAIQEGYYDTKGIIPITEREVHLFPGKAWFSFLESQRNTYPPEVKKRIDTLLKGYQVYHAGGMLHSVPSRTSLFAFLQPQTVQTP